MTSEVPLLRVESTLLLSLCFLFGCGGCEPHHRSEVTGPDMAAEDCLGADYVCIRVKNTSMFDFGRFNVHFPNYTEKYGSIRAGEISAYRRTDRAHGYAYTEAFSRFRKFVLQPKDYVGERDLLPGIYTYEYSAEARKKMNFGGGRFLRGEMDVMLIDDSDSI